MAAGSTYTPIATTTLGSAAASYTFSSIPSTYTDLVLIAVGTLSDGGNLGLRFNSDSGANYSNTVVYGSGTAALSARSTSTTGLVFASMASSTNYLSNAIINIMNYSNTTTYKTALERGNNNSTLVRADVGLWRSTAAINSIYVYDYTGGNLDTGLTLTLYGIQAA
jgi:hypothetical protein